MNGEEHQEIKAKEEREDYNIASGVLSGIGISVAATSLSPLSLTPMEGFVAGFAIIVLGLIIFAIGRKKTA